MSAAAPTIADSEPSPEVDFEPYVNSTYDTPLPTPKELVKKGISLDLIGKAVGLDGLRFTPTPRKVKGEDGDKEGKVDGEDGNGWEDDAEDGEEDIGKRVLELSVQMYATMTRPERKEMMNLLEANMKVMYVILFKFHICKHNQLYHVTRGDN